MAMETKLIATEMQFVLVISRKNDLCLSQLTFGTVAEHQVKNDDDVYLFFSIKNF